MPNEPATTLIDEPPSELRVGEWLVCPCLHTLTSGASTHRVGHKVMAVLLCLAERPGEVRSKNQLIEQVWDGAYTSDEALAAVIYELRRALGDKARDPRYIETIRKGGYRLVAEVEAVLPSAQPVSASPAPTAPRPATLATGAARSSRSPRRFALAALIVLSMMNAAALWVRARVEPQAETRPPVQSVAVLPMSALALGPFADECSQQDFAYGLAERLSANLREVAPIEITPSIALRGYEERWDLRQVAEKLGVDAVVEGSVLYSGERLWLSVELIEVDSGQLLWGGTYERQVEDAFSLQRELALDISAKIRPHLGSEGGSGPFPKRISS